MLRRLHTPQLRVGDIVLDPVQARHARDVLRLADGQTVELFDDHGAVAAGVLAFTGPRQALVRVREISVKEDGLRWTIAAAVPKGERADWMIEKLSELGATTFIPLITTRSVVVPQGKNKLDRWARIATESAKQSRRRGVMRIEEPTPLAPILEHVKDGSSQGVYLSTEPAAVPILAAMERHSHDSELILFVGPEGGWADDELQQFKAAGAIGARLTSTVLRVETAAVATASVVGTVLAAE